MIVSATNTFYAIYKWGVISTFSKYTKLNVLLRICVKLFIQIAIDKEIITKNTTVE